VCLLTAEVIYCWYWWSSHRGTTVVTWPRRDVNDKSCWWQFYQVMLATVLSWQLGRGAMWMRSHAGDGSTESCWWWCCRGILATARYRYRVILTMVQSSHAGDGAAESCWWQRCRGDIGRGTMSLPRWLSHGAMSLSSHAGNVAALGCGTMYLSSHAAQPESESTIEVVMCDRSQNVPTL
jgi:hypothetical protein